MKILQWIFRYSHVIGIFILCLACAWKVNSLLSPHTIIILFDNKIDSNIQAALKHEIYALPNGYENASRLFDALHKEFPSIASISYVLKNPAVAYLSIKAEQPRLCLVHDREKKLVVTETSKIIEGTQFTQDALAQLPIIKVMKSNFKISFNNQIGASLLAIQQELFDNFLVILKSKNEIDLSSKKYNDLMLVSDITSIHHKEKIAFAETLYEKKHEQYKQGMIIDIRLKDYVVARSLGRGVI